MKAKVAVIGAGPAGITAAVQLRRAKVEVLLIEKQELGGLCREANWLENMPGFMPGIPGLEYAKRLKQQVAFWEVPFVFGRLTSVSGHNGGFVCELEDQRQLVSDYVIFATGTSPRRPEYAGVQPGQPIYFSPLAVPAATQSIAVIGAGDVGLDYALLLQKRGVSLQVFARTQTRAIARLLEQCETAGVEVVNDCRDFHVSADKDGILLSHAHGKQRFSAVLYAIGREPNDEALQVLRPFDIAEHNCETSRSGLYVCGSVRTKKSFRQIVIAAAEGMRAAQDIITKESQ